MEERLHDSGTRQLYTTGAQRDAAKGKGRFDLDPALAMFRVACHMEKGAEKYDERNWEKGIPISRFINSAIRHIRQYQLGLDDEDHLAAAAWNIMCALETEERVNLKILPRELDDMPKLLRGFTKDRKDDIGDFCGYDTAMGELYETKVHQLDRLNPDWEKEEEPDISLNSLGRKYSWPPEEDEEDKGVCPCGRSKSPCRCDQREDE